MGPFQIIFSPTSDGRIDENAERVAIKDTRRISVFAVWTLCATEMENLRQPSSAVVRVL
jgi:hypothetical protein